MTRGLDACQQRLTELRRLFLPNMFVGWVPWAFGVVVCALAGIITQVFLQSTDPSFKALAISVGSTDKSNHVSWFSNVASFLSLFAPGESITSSVPGGGFESFSGTSMAAPHVAGAWAVLRQAVPGASVDTILGAFRSTGLPIADNRIFFGGGAVIPRVSVLQALASLVPVTNPIPAIASLSPARVRAGMGAVTFSVTGTGFNGLSVASWNGTPLTLYFMASGFFANSLAALAR